MTPYVILSFKRSKGFVRGLHYVALCVFATATLVASACVRQTPPSGEDMTEGTQALTATSKVCEALWNGTTDSIDVPDSWTIATCGSWAKSVDLNDYRVGCVFDDNSFSWGTRHFEPFGAGLPNPNCDWTCAANFGSFCVAGTCKCGRTQRGLPGSIDCEGICLAEEACSDLCGF